MHDALLRLGCHSTRVVAAVSGGVDSMVMLHGLVRLRQELGLDIHVAHANHGLRGAESDADEAFVARTCTTLRIHFHSARLDVYAEADESGKGLEGAARTLRYAFLDDTATRVGARYILTAHTQDDVAETFLMNVWRGAGLHGLSGIAESRRTAAGHTLLRPMLGSSRTQILETAAAQDITWREDATNDDVHFLRNKIRHNVLPVLREQLGPDVSSRICASASRLREVRGIVDAVVHEASVNTLVVDGGRVHIDTTGLAAYSVPVQTQVVRQALNQVLGSPADAAATRRTLALMQAATGSRADIAHGYVAIRNRTHILLDKPADAFRIDVVLHPGERYVAGLQQLHVRLAEGVVVPTPHSSVAEIDVRSVHGPLVWRIWQDGDRFNPLGMDGTVRVSDLLTNARIPHSRRRYITVVADDDGILWVCGIRLAHRARIVHSTTSAYVLTYQDETL